MSRIGKQLASLQKRIAIIEDRLKHESNLADIKEMISEISKGMDKSAPEPRDFSDIEPIKKPPSHILQTGFRVL